GGDFVRGIGVRFEVPMRDAAYDRHIRIGGEGTGLLAVLGVVGITVAGTRAARARRALTPAC
ncbi:hypothetical protein PV406_19395, partial [Streptomyces scabiei]